MRDEPPIAESDEPSELDGLRERAYGPHADILTDPVALDRLHALESLVRTRNATRTANASRGEDAALTQGGASGAEDRAENRAEPPAPGLRTEDADPGLSSPWLTMRGRWRVVLGVASVVAAVGAVAFAMASGRSSDPVADPGSTTSAVIPVVEDQQWSTSSAAGYDLFLDHLRAEVLSGPGMSELAPRLIRDELRPYGSLYGRTVWAGSTTDAQYCMIIADSPLPAIACIWIDDAYASASAITLPSGTTTSAFDVSVIPGTPVIYTILPGGQVTAAPVE